MNNCPVYSPHRCWNLFLDKAYSYDAVIRVAPLLGNDYTTHDSIISATRNANDVRDLFNLDDNFNALKLNSRKKIWSVVNKVSKPDGFTDVSAIDEMIYNFDHNYFKKYYLSTIIYKNWNIYNRCSIRHSANDASEFDKLIHDAILKILERIMKTHSIIYEWQSQYLFIDWANFIANITVLHIDKTTDLFDYYTNMIQLEDDYASEYVDGPDDAVDESAMEPAQDYCDEYI